MGAGNKYVADFPVSEISPFRRGKSIFYAYSLPEKPMKGAKLRIFYILEKKETVGISVQLPTLLKCKN